MKQKEEVTGSQRWTVHLRSSSSRSRPSAANCRNCISAAKTAVGHSNSEAAGNPASLHQSSLRTARPLMPAYTSRPKRLWRCPPRPTARLTAENRSRSCKQLHISGRGMAREDTPATILMSPSISSHRRQYRSSNNHPTCRQFSNEFHNKGDNIYEFQREYEGNEIILDVEIRFQNQRQYACRFRNMKGKLLNYIKIYTFMQISKY
nr:hypothetical protein Itr_chr07CG12090 [Ipomoea trifida]